MVACQGICCGIAGASTVLLLVAKVVLIILIFSQPKLHEYLHIVSVCQHLVTN